MAGLRTQQNQKTKTEAELVKRLDVKLIAQQGHTSDRTDFGQCHPIRWPVREIAIIDKPRGHRITNKERCDREVEFVCEALGEELGVDLAATLDHEAADAALAEVVEHGTEVDYGSERDDIG